MIKLFTCIILILSCSIQAQDRMSDLDWLAGTWAMTRSDGSTQLEIWKPESEHALAGKGLRIVGNDTLLMEMLEIKSQDGEIWYIPTVPDQNQGLPIPFRLISSMNHQYVFENPEHDFPQRIIYTYRPVSSHGNAPGATVDQIDVRVEHGW